MLLLRCYNNKLETTKKVLNMKKMMYILNVNWNWIKQRPQYLAEALSRYYNLDVFEKKSYRQINLIENNSDNVNLYKLFRLPFQGRMAIIKKINSILIRYQIAKRIDKYEYVWFASATDYGVIKKYLKDKIIIYDCMDDQIEFPEKKNDNDYIANFLKDEYALLKDSNYVFASADHLKDVLLTRYSDINPNKICVLNNAITSKLLDEYKKSIINNKKKGNKVITYIGTISQWIDWEKVIDSLRAFDNIEYHFYGPIASGMPTNERLMYKGIIQQKEIFTVMKKSDMLIMPFIVNDLILSVNPVKLYEYILSGVTTLSCRYIETEKFEDYVYLYRDEREYMEIMQKLSNGTLKSKSEDSYNFVKNNTWENRAQLISEIIGV